MKALGKFLLLRRQKEPETSKLIEVPDNYKQANAFPRGEVLSKGKDVTLDVQKGDIVVFKLFNATSIKGMDYHIHEESVLAKEV